MNREMLAKSVSGTERICATTKTAPTTTATASGQRRRNAKGAVHTTT
jgi:hypothetical protein